MSRKLLLLSGLLALAGSALLWLGQSPAPAPTVAERPGFTVPAFSWHDFSGQEHKLTDFAGKVVVLHFWASWCAPCRTEFPMLQQAARDMPEVMFLAISSDSDRAKAEKMLADVGATQPPANLLLAWDPQKAVTYDIFLTAAFPETIILDRQHRQRRKIANVVAWDDPGIRDYLRAMTKN